MAPGKTKHFQFQSENYKILMEIILLNKNKINVIDFFEKVSRNNCFKDVLKFFSNYFSIFEFTSLYQLFR